MNLDKSKSIYALIDAKNIHMIQINISLLVRQKGMTFFMGVANIIIIYSFFLKKN